MKLLQTFSGAIINIERYAREWARWHNGKEVKVFYLPSLPTVIERVEVWG